MKKIACVLAVVVTLALAPSVTPVGPGQATEAEALDLQWGLIQGPPELGLPAGGGAFIDVAVVPGTDTVFVLCDQGDNDLDGLLNEDPCEGVDNDLDGLVDEDPAVVVYRSDDGGYSWVTPSCVPVVGVNEVGVDIEVSPSYSQDGMVLVLTNDMSAAHPGTGRVYASKSNAVGWPWVTPGLPASPNCLAVCPTFSSLLGGTIAVGGRFDGFGACVWYQTWQGPTSGWTNTWTSVLSFAGDTPDCLALMYPPTSSLRLISVQITGDNDLDGAFDEDPVDGVDNDLDTFVDEDPVDAATFGVTGGLSPGPAASFPQLLAGNTPAVTGTSDGADLLHVGAATNAVIAIGSDYVPVSSPACVNCPMQFFVGTAGIAPPNGSSTFWFDTTLAMFVDLKAASKMPAAHMATSGLAARGPYRDAELLAGCADVPLTYNMDVGTMAWGSPVFIETGSGSIGTVSNNVGVKLAYGGYDSQAYAITTQVPAPAYGVAPAATPGDLTCLSASSDFGGSWIATSLTQESFINRVVDMVWIEAGAGLHTGLVVCDDGTGVTSVFKSLASTQWKLVDRRQGVQRIAVSSDYEPGTGTGAIFLLDTSSTSGKVLRSLDDGDSFTAVAVDPVAIATIPMTCIAAGTANDIFVGDWNGHVYVTHDGGDTPWIDAGQVASKIKSLDVPVSYSTVRHVIAGVDSFDGRQDVLVSKDDGATWGPAGIAMWGHGGLGTAGHIEAKFSPSYDGTSDRFAYAGTLGTADDNMYRADLSVVESWTDMALPTGAPTSVGNFDMGHIPGISGDPTCDENSLYVLEAGTNRIFATYYPELVSQARPLWRPDVANPALWQASGETAVWAVRDVTPGGTLIPCPFQIAAGASVTLIARDSVDALPPRDLVWSITETDVLLTPISACSPADGAILPSNNRATGEPVELQWPAVSGAAAYDVMTITDIDNPTAVLAAGTTSDIASTVFSIAVGSLADGESYYWRVRSSRTAYGTDHTGPWSAWRSFSVGFQGQASPASIRLVSPVVGATDVPLVPSFAWKATTQTAADSVTGYVFRLATDPSFSEETILVDENIGMQQGYTLSEELEYETTYCWSVTASGKIGAAGWTLPPVEGIFTTAAEVIEPEPTPQPTPSPPVVIEDVAAESPAWVWVLVSIGAVLAVAVIVLIMRTRRLV